jgi:O-acetyl-ADP-ribose deacetylase (regulator of RNase III)
MKIEVIRGDITKQPGAEAIVNSANANLRFGSGVTGAIHTAAGPKLEIFCRPHAPLALGAALLTPAFNMQNQWIIHVRAAHFLNDDEPENYLEMALDAMMKIAQAHNIRSLAIPAIGTGVFKCPPDLAAKITARVLKKHAAAGTTVEWARLCVVTPQLQAVYASALK